MKVWARTDRVVDLPRFGDQAPLENQMLPLSFLASGSRGLSFSVMLICLTMLGTGGCRKVKNALGISDRVVSPEAGTPEALVGALLKTGIADDEQKAWSEFEALLHSELRRQSDQMDQCQRDHWPVFRLKAPSLIEDKGTMAYTIQDDREFEEARSDGTKVSESEGPRIYRKVFLDNRGSRLTTPITLKRDQKADGAWRISSCRL